MSTVRGRFRDFFRRATDGCDPYEYQVRLATETCLEEPHSVAIHVPTGAGKTEAAVLCWLWNRCANPDKKRRGRWPRRLVYCLPMRVLVEQTRARVEEWLLRTGLRDRVGVHVLMGGERVRDWDLEPEREAILVGTQDMLLSRALNRGYAMSRYRWPMHFGLLNNDCLWVVDEVQLMGSGLATTSQLQAFRREHGVVGTARTFWLSATFEGEWLKTIDFAVSDLEATVGLTGRDMESPELARRMEASKPLKRSTAVMGELSKLARAILGQHVAGSRTLVIVNTVKRARDLFHALQAVRPLAMVVLIHSRFRPPDRSQAVEGLLSKPGEQGTIAVATQVVEAGVDVSAKKLFTELAPWASLVQRFGRCNRLGLDPDAQVFWIDVPGNVDLGKGVDREVHSLAAPYRAEDLQVARHRLRSCKEGVGPNRLVELNLTLPFEHTHVIRRGDFIDLFDTTPDLAGNDIDVSRYVRDVEDNDVHVFWRDLGGRRPSADERMPTREELCAVSIGAFREFVKTLAKKGMPQTGPYRRDDLEDIWVPATRDRIYPGQIYLLDVSAGGYDTREGWTGMARDATVSQLHVEAPAPEGYGEDLQYGVWRTIAEHTDEVCRTLELILVQLGLDTHAQEALVRAARWHDRGKAHPVFQDAVDDGQEGRHTRPVEWKGRRNVGKAPGGSVARGVPGFMCRYRRRYFRHELASALAVFQNKDDLTEKTRDLVAYLVAAHHGKVRMSMRSLPGEDPAPRARRFARGIWDGDALEATDLGEGVTASPVSLSLEPMELGRSASDEPSWAERALKFLDDPELGPFRLGYLEALLRAADMRASAAARENISA